MKNETIYAEFILAEAAHKIRLETKVNATRLDYYFRGSIPLVFLFGIVTGAGILWLPSHTEIPLFGLGAVYCAIMALAESKRNADRIDALLKLRELELARIKHAAASGNEGAHTEKLPQPETVKIKI
jgi:hypothetical protein